VSIGITELKNQDSLLKRADKAQLSGQKQGGNMVIVAGKPDQEGEDEMQFV